MARKIDRRAILRGIGAAGVTGTIGLSGCLGDDEDGNGNGNGNGDEEAEDEADTGNGEDAGNGGDGETDADENETNGDDADENETDETDGNETDDETDDNESDDAAEDVEIDLGREVMVGVLQPTTGDLGDLGGPIRDGAILPGTQLEGTGLELDIREEDTQTDEEAGISAAQALVDAGYPGITGAAASSTTIPVADTVLAPNQVVGISPASTAPAITDLEDDDFLFRTCPSDALQGEVMAELANDEGYETAASFHLNNDYGQQLSESFVSAFEELGGEVTEEVAFEAEQPSYSSVLETALGDNPDVMIVIGYPASGQQIFRDYYNDFDDGETTIMVTDGLRDDGLPGNVDNEMANVIGTAPLAAGPQVDAFTEMYEEEYDRSPGVFTAQAYDATAVLILANVAAGDNDGTAVRDNIREVANPEGEVVGPENLAEGIAMVADGEEVQYEGASSDVNFDDNGDMQAVTYEIFEFSMDGVETVDEIDYEA